MSENEYEKDDLQDKNDSTHVHNPLYEILDSLERTLPVLFPVVQNKDGHEYAYTDSLV